MFCSTPTNERIATDTLKAIGVILGGPDPPLSEDVGSRLESGPLTFQTEQVILEYTRIIV